MGGNGYPFLQGRELIVVSNRGPASYQLAPDGSVSASRGAGGLVSAFLALARELPFRWVAAAVTPGDRLLARKTPYLVFQPSLSSYPLPLRLVYLPKTIFRRFYNVASNTFLWALHHYLLDLNRLPDLFTPLLIAWQKGYVPANQPLPPLSWT